MATESGRLDYWRKYLRSANCDVFAVIDNAILVAATDYPADFLAQRVRIAERLFSCHLPRCFSCDRVKEQPLKEEEGEFLGGERREGGHGCAEKESKANSCASERQVDANRVASNYSYDEAEALTEEMEEEGQLLGEVLRIKEVLVKKDESETVLRESLRKLQLIVISVDILKGTEIGKAVSDLRKHKSREIRQLVRTLVDGWKVMVDEWIATTRALTESTPESVKPSVADNDNDLGLPSPPMDEGVLFATQGTMELSKIFDGMDDDGNFHNVAEFGKGQASQSKSSVGNPNTMRKQQVVSGDDIPVRKQEAMRVEKPVEVTKRSNLQQFFTVQRKPSGDVNKQNVQAGSSGTAVGHGRPQGTSVSHENRSQLIKEIGGAQKKALTGAQQTPESSDDFRDKIEAAKRKLHERYQEADNAKKQRTVQVIELQDIPKQGVNHRQPSIKQGNNSRRWANTRR